LWRLPTATGDGGPGAVGDVVVVIVPWTLQHVEGGGLGGGGRSGRKVGDGRGDGKGDGRGDGRVGDGERARGKGGSGRSGALGARHDSGGLGRGRDHGLDGGIACLLGSRGVALVGRNHVGHEGISDINQSLFVYDIHWEMSYLLAQVTVQPGSAHSQGLTSCSCMMCDSMFARELAPL
jgi:hypothetical protein